MSWRFKAVIAVASFLTFGRFLGFDFVIDPALNYPANLVCHARGGDYYYNNPLGLRCVNAADWQLAMCRNGDDYFCSKQEFWRIYFNSHWG